MIENIKKKLIGELPVTREELFKIVSSWGRTENFYTSFNGGLIKISEAKECYPLDKLDVSKIEDLSMIFYGSKFNEDISKWNISSCKNMKSMFSKSNFKGNIFNWNFNEKINCESLFDGNKAFAKEWNDGSKISNNSNKFLKFIATKQEELNIKITNKEENLNVKLKENKSTLELFLKEKNINPKSELGQELIKIYDEKQSSLKEQINNLKKDVESIAELDFFSK